MQLQAEVAALESRPRSPAQTALRMALYPVLGIALVVALFFSPQVREECYYWQWQYAKEAKDKETYFENLLAATKSRARREKYVARRATEQVGALATEKGWEWFSSMIARGYGGALAPTLAKALGNKDKDIRYVAVYALGDIGPAVKAVVPALIKALGDKYIWVRKAAAVALGKIGPVTKQVVPALIKALCDENEDVRWSAAYVLGRIGPAAKEAVPALIKALGDKEWRVRSAATQALKKIAKDTPKENNKAETLP